MMIILLTVACALKTGGERYQASDEESNHEVYAPLCAIDPNARLRVYISRQPLKHLRLGRNSVDPITETIAEGKNGGVVAARRVNADPIAKHIAVELSWIYERND